MIKSVVWLIRSVFLPIAFPAIPLLNASFVIASTTVRDTPLILLGSFASVFSVCSLVVSAAASVIRKALHTPTHTGAAVSVHAGVGWEMFHCRVEIEPAVIVRGVAVKDVACVVHILAVKVLRNCPAFAVPLAPPCLHVTL